MLTWAQLRLLAARQVAHGAQLTRDHLPDGTGCCCRCGREYPCDGHHLGCALIAYYGNLIGRAEASARRATGPASADIVGMDHRRVRHAPR